LIPLANAHGQITRQAARIRQLERRLCELLGEQAWRESGLGAPADIDQLQRRITDLEQQVVDLKDQFDERDHDLDAARAANRDLITNLNRRN
jgi:cell division protein FtsB